MGEIGFPELLVILVIALLVFGGKRLPEVARGLGEAIREFQKALRGSNHGGGEEKNIDRSLGGPQSPAGKAGQGQVSGSGIRGGNT